MNIKNIFFSFLLSLHVDHSKVTSLLVVVIRCLGKNKNIKKNKINEARERSRSLMK